MLPRRRVTMLPLDPVTLFYGKSLTGKTARMFYELRDSKRVVLVDPKCSQLVAMKGWDHLWPEYAPPASVQERKEKLGRWKTRGVVGYFSGRDSFRVVLHLRKFHVEHLELLSMFLMADVKDCVLAVDELYFFAPPGAPGLLGEFFGQLLVSGTHDGVSFVGTVQGAMMVHNRVRMNACRSYIFRTDERNDLALLNAKLPADFPDALDTLPDYVCVVVADGQPPYTDYTQAGKLGHVLPGRRF